MRKQIFTLILCLLVAGLANAQVILDPAKLDAGSLPTGSSIVTIDGVKCLKVPLTGWTTVVSVPAVTINSNNTNFKAIAKLISGTSGFTLDKVNTFIQPATNSPWDTYGAIGAASTADFSTFVGTFEADGPGKVIDAVQLAGQETTGWTAVTGDTLVIQYVVAYNPLIIFNPETFTPVAAGQEIVTIDGAKYLKVALTGWTTVLQVSATTIDAGYDKFNAVAKYEVGTSGFTIDKINTFIQPATNSPWATYGSIGAASTADFSTFVGTWDAAVAGKTIDAIQLAGQETTGWTAVTGDFIYLGMVKTYKAQAVDVVFDPELYKDSTLAEGLSIVQLDGKYYLKAVGDGNWGPSMTIKSYNTGSFNRIYADIKYEQGTATYDAAHTQTGVNVGTSTTYDLANLGISPSPTVFTTDTSVIAQNLDVNHLQIYAQNTTDWNSVAGCAVYVGIIKAKFKKDELVVPTSTANIPYIGEETYTMDINGLADEDVYDKAYEDAEDATAGNIVDNIATGSVDGVAAAKDAVAAADNTDSYGGWVAMWDDNNFYFFIDVTDNDPINVGASTAPWNNDGIELFLDIKDRRFQNGSRITGEQHQIRFNLGTEGPAYGNDKNMASTTFGTTANDTTDIAYYAAVGSIGYSIELAIPWATFYKTSTNTLADAYAAAYTNNTELFDGKKIAFEVSILDASALDTRKSILNWSNYTGTDVAYQYNQYYGQLNLTGKVGINDKKAAQSTVAVHPNPVNTMLYVEMNNVKTIEVYNMAGVKVMTDNGDAFANVAELQTGMYIVKATDINGKVGVAKFNKQ
jgi:hypothetical protein